MQFISPILWDDAIDKIGDETPIGSALTSEEWSQLPLALRERAFFSAQVENIRFLQRARDFITDYMSHSIETLPNGNTALKAGSRQQFIKDMQDFAISEGMGPLDAADSGTIKDITSEGRLGLLFDVKTQAANDYAYWKQGQNPDVLDAYPAQRFIRERDVKQPRPVHQENDGVVRLKSDLDFWMAMNDPSFGGFGVPWGPWGFKSGMGVEDVDRGESEDLGLIDPDKKPTPVEQDFNDRLQASTQGLDDDMIAKLKDAFGDQVAFEDDAVKWKAAPPEGGTPNEEPKGGTPNTETLDNVLSDLGLDKKQTATASDMKDLREQLQEDKPADALKYIKFIKGAQPSGALTDENISNFTQEFLSFIPEANILKLPKLQIEVVKSGNFIGKYRGGGVLQLNAKYLQFDEERLRRNLFHELMHWLHREGSQDYQDAIAEHFAERTAGEKIKKLPGYSSFGKKDDWYDAYAGTIYPFETTPGGLEVPTRYIEWLTFTPDKMAELWNDPQFRETMKIVLQGLF